MDIAPWLHSACSCLSALLSNCASYKVRTASKAVIAEIDAAATAKGCVRVGEVKTTLDADAAQQLANLLQSIR